jgi:hypothetical protein
MIFQKATSKTIFKPSFGNKKGQTEFYQILIDKKPVAEIEIKPINKFGKPEILSAFTEPYHRGNGYGEVLVKNILDIYLKDELYVMTTKESKPFWIKMGAKEFDGFMCLFSA